MQNSNQNDVSLNVSNYASTSPVATHEEQQAAISPNGVFSTERDPSLDDCLKVLLHNKMRVPHCESSEVVDAVAELSVAFDLGFSKEKSDPFKNYADEHRARRSQLIDNLREQLADSGVVVLAATIKKWLAFCAERALLIDVLDKPNPTLQPLYRSEFSRIDDALGGIFDEDFYSCLIGGPPQN